MINKGIVTESDTEKELQAWKDARGAAVDENKIRQQYKNRLNNAQGQHFEREILAGCRMYESHGIASIDKTPEPFKGPYTAVALLCLKPRGQAKTE